MARPKIVTAVLDAAVAVLNTSRAVDEAKRFRTDHLYHEEPDDSRESCHECGLNELVWKRAVVRRAKARRRLLDATEALVYSRVAIREGGR